MMYQLTAKYYDEHSSTFIQGTVFRKQDKCFIPFSHPNTDYQQFKADILSGTPLQDAEGNTLSQTEAEAFIATLP